MASWSLNSSETANLLVQEQCSVSWLHQFTFLLLSFGWEYCMMVALNFVYQTEFGVS